MDIGTCQTCKGTFPIIKTGQTGTQKLIPWHFVGDTETMCNGSQAPPAQ